VFRVACAIGGGTDSADDGGAMMAVRDKKHYYLDMIMISCDGV